MAYWINTILSLSSLSFIIFIIRKQARDLILNTVRLRDKVTDAFMEKLSVGEYPVQLGAETLAFGFGKTYASDMNNVVTSCGAASFQHSSVMASFFEGRNLTSAVIEQTVSLLSSLYSLFGLFWLMLHK